MLFEFVLFAILGWCAFAPPAQSTGKMVLMIVFIVLMVLWAIFGIGPIVGSGGWGGLFRR